MRFENYKPSTEKEKELRRRVHARAILNDLTMREVVFAALELWLKESDAQQAAK